MQLFEIVELSYSKYSKFIYALHKTLLYSYFDYHLVIIITCGKIGRIYAYSEKKANLPEELNTTYQSKSFTRFYEKRYAFQNFFASENRIK